MRTRAFIYTAVFLHALACFSVISEKQVMANPERETLFRLGFEGKPVKSSHDTNSRKFDIITSKSTDEQCAEGTYSFKLDLTCTDGDFFNLRFNLPEVIPLTPETSLTGWIQNKRGYATLGAKLIIRNPFPRQKDLSIDVTCSLDKQKNADNNWINVVYPAGKLYNDVISFISKILGDSDITSACAGFYVYCQPAVIDKLYIHVGTPIKGEHTVYVDNIEIRGVSDKVDTAKRYQEKAETMTKLLRSELKKVKKGIRTIPGGMVEEVNQVGEIMGELRILKEELSKTPANLEDWMRLCNDIINMGATVKDIYHAR